VTAGAPEFVTVTVDGVVCVPPEHPANTDTATSAAANTPNQRLNTENTENIENPFAPPRYAQ
jgi:hypothetical protein